ncbi:MAG: DUF4412 domain-containing protein [Syntrophomonadaceae bacterium]|nr:DUF4412 domain-containing protein [Syntrophomonadaceae bacterium]
MKKWLVLMILSIFVAASLVGCGSRPTTTTTTDAPTTTDNKAAGSGDDLSQLMKSAAGVKEMSFDMVATVNSKSGSMSSNGKMYMSNGKVHMEMEQAGMKMVTIIKSQSEIYLYNPDSKIAMKTSAPQNQVELPNQWAKADGDVSGLKVIGNENKDGFECLVITTGDNAKMWIRKDIGMPVRVESPSNDGSVVIEYKNFNLGSQDASLFELPAGTQITDMPITDILNAPKP